MFSRAVLATTAVAAFACAGEPDLELPAESALTGLYGETAEVRLNGNVVDVRAEQSLHQVRRGGDLWARVGPYIYLFSPQTQEVFERWGGVAAVRVRTFTPGGTRIAEAMLLRDTLTAVTWKKAAQRVAKARLEGTKNPGHLEALVRFGEDYARYEYNPRFIQR